ncbi:MAG: uridine kinase [Phycisphaerales bacterium]|jgi:uridine kinase
MKPERIERVNWESAVEAVLELTRQRAKGTTDRPVIAVTGRVSAGKSLLARRLAEAAAGLAWVAGEGLVHTTDDYLPDYEGLPIEDVDRPEHSHLNELAGHLRRLRAGEAIEAPVWSFHTHGRTGTRPLGPAGLIVLEGIHALNPMFREIVHVSVFVEAAATVRWDRRAAIEEAGERGWGVEKARDHFDRVAEPTFAEFEAQYLASADVVVLNDGGPG